MYNRWRDRVKNKKYLEDVVLGNTNKNLRIISVGIINKDNAQNEIIKISRDHDIAAIVGTIDPELESIPFISFQDILKESGKLRLKEFLGINKKQFNPLINVIDEELIKVNNDSFTKSDLIDEMCSLLISKGRVSENFTMSVYKREMLGGTLFEGTFGIPHGLSEFVEKSSIAIFKLNNPILWDYNCMVDVVIMLALKENDGKVVRQLFDTLSKTEVANKLRKSNSPKEISDILLKI